MRRCIATAIMTQAFASSLTPLVSGSPKNINIALTKRVYESYIKFRDASLRWTDISERAYLNARALEFPYGR